MIVQLARVILVTAGALGGFAVSQQVDWTAGTGYSESFVIIIFIILGASIGYVLGGITGREFNVACRNISARLSEMDTPALLLGAVGLLVGLLVAFILSSALLRYIERPLWLGFAATALLFVLCAYAGVALFMLPARDGTLNLGISAGTPVDTRPPKLLDTSAVIDGRFADLARVGVLEGPLRVPRFVLMELQTLADSADDGRRARGRRGLDLLTTLSAAETAVQVLEADFPEIPTVDAKLVRLALTSGGAIVTVDHNLTKVARVEGATVVNVHEVAEALKPVLLPGDSLRLDITKEGKERDQGVGYLGDGTMVVVADGAGLIGSEADIRVTSVLQTAGGRMVFGKPVTPE
ncbi:MAG: hypothetical protein JW733_06860 [Coriobacteriia bacterium]|nr:hypothetical protein [Coriobacteriia bacterium]MBN2839933.1 hypothetical protein [Coriobacteriia bacterium]